MKNLIVLLATLFSLAVLPSCGDCNSDNCKNGSICMNGECECLAGFEGESCEIIIREKLIGNYTVSSTCDDNSTPTEGWAIAASSAETFEIFINNFHKPAFNVIGTVISSTSFNIDEQTISELGVDYTFTGFADIDSNGNLMAEYTVVIDSLPIINCTAQATPN